MLHKKTAQIQKAQIQHAQRTSSRINANNNNKTYAYHIQTTENKRQMTFKLEKTSPMKGAKERMTFNFSKTMQGKKEWSEIFQVERKNNQPRVQYSMKFFFIRNGRNISSHKIEGICYQYISLTKDVGNTYLEGKKMIQLKNSHLH